MVTGGSFIVPMQDFAASRSVAAQTDVGFAVFTYGR
jgi:hypothetical protein